MATSTNLRAFQQFYSVFLSRLVVVRQGHCPTGVIRAPCLCRSLRRSRGCRSGEEKWYGLGLTWCRLRWYKADGRLWRKKGDLFDRAEWIACCTTCCKHEEIFAENRMVWGRDVGKDGRGGLTVTSRGRWMQAMDAARASSDNFLGSFSIVVLLVHLLAFSIFPSLRVSWRCFELFVAFTVDLQAQQTPPPFPINPARHLHKLPNYYSALKTRWLAERKMCTAR